jgi:hypothetical protein
VFERLRRRLTFANVVSLAALFVALGGTTYAGIQIHGSQIANRSISGSKIKRNALGRTTIKESRLGKVPRARRADRLGGHTAAFFRLQCPNGTIPVSGVCIEARARARIAYGIARSECGAINRRLPTYEELSNLVSGSAFSVAPGGELTSSVLPPTGPWTIDVITVTGEAGESSRTSDTAGGAKAFRCVAYPSN